MMDKKEAPRTAATVQSAETNLYHNASTKNRDCQIIRFLPPPLLKSWIITVDPTLKNGNTIVISRNKYSKDAANEYQCGIFTKNPHHITYLITKSIQEYDRLRMEGALKESITINL